MYKFLVRHTDQRSYQLSVECVDTDADVVISVVASGVVGESEMSFSPLENGFASGLTGVVSTPCTMSTWDTDAIEEFLDNCEALCEGLVVDVVMERGFFASLRRRRVSLTIESKSTSFDGHVNGTL